VASKLTEKEKQLLDANLNTRIGLKPYEDGLWGSQGSKDFVYFELFDNFGNLIQFENIPSSEFVVNTDNNNIEFYPGNHIRNLGYQSGVFNIKYNFLRRLAGNESPVLLHTLNKNNTKIGDVYTNTNNIYITDDSIVYAANEEDYKLNPTTTEQLAIEDLTYQIHEISPSRTEVRLKAKKINGSYTDEFVDIQTAVKLQDVSNQISFNGDAIYDATDLILTTQEDGFLFTQKMVNGTIKIPDVFKVSQVEIPVTTGINIINNPGGESVVTDNLGNINNLATAWPWDETLHDDAIEVENWISGFSYQRGSFAGTEHLGYHAKWVQTEGKDGGNCIKFTDQNAAFIDLPEWPNEQRYRKLTISQEVTNLQGQGVKHGDIANINLDVRSTVANKGVEIILHYADLQITEDRPVGGPEGWYDPFAIGPTEVLPVDAFGYILPPEGYYGNTGANASLIEDYPGDRLDIIIATYDIPGGDLDLIVGSTTSLWGGAGAWSVNSISGNVITWNPNVPGAITMEGTLSTEEQWRWDGSTWTVNPNYSAPNVPTPPVDSVSTLEFPTAVNSHPYQIQGQGVARFSRPTYPGENRGWFTGTSLDSDDTKMVSVCGVNADLISNTAVILLKDDLVWIVGEVGYNTNKNKIDVITFDTMFPSVHVKTTSDGNGGVHSVYNDIFKQGRIQSITRTRETGNADGGDHTRDNHFIVFYTDGRNTDESNKTFMAECGAATFASNSPDLVLLKDLNSSFNDILNQSGGQMEWVYDGKKKDGTKWNHFASIKGTNKRWQVEDGDGDFYEISSGTDFFLNGTGATGTFSANVQGVKDNYFEVHFSIRHENNHFSHYSGIESGTIHDASGGQWINMKSDLSGVADRRVVNDYFYGAGEVSVGGSDLIFGSRNPGADNYVENATYDDGSSETSYSENPTMAGTMSELGLYRWSGNIDVGWEGVDLSPPSFQYVSPGATRVIVAPEIAGEWVNLSVQIPIPANWLLGQKWYFYIKGNGKSTTDDMEQGIVWVDNVYVDFTLLDQSVTVPVYKPYTAQISSVSNDGSIISVNKSIRELALEIGANDGDEDGNPDIYNLSDNLSSFENFRVTYTNFNPKDLRTYLKFENNLFLTTNFKSDRVNVTSFPYSVIYKLYKPLPGSYEKFDECIVVKEMANPLEEKIKIIDFVNAEEPNLVLRSPDLNNVESPVQRRETQFKTESDILTNDVTVSTALRNEFLSQSLDSVEINTDFSKFANFVNFGSSEVRVRNFKTKLEDIEGYKISSASYEGVSGSLGDMSTYHHNIIDTENKFDRFEKYMYFQSSSYISSSIGIFHDNAWPKTGGSGTLSNPYVLAHTTSSQATTWFRNSINSSSLYDDENSSKLSSILPEHIKFDTKNDTYLKFTDMIGQHFDGIWEYINSITDVTDRRESLSEGISKDLLHSVAKSLGWNLNDGKDLLSLSRYALGKEVTGSAFATYSEKTERDISREIWSRIINNMPFFLKNKGTVRALKGLINIYGIPSTILRVKEYGGPALSDDASPQFEITRKFTKALDFRGGQSVKVAWADDASTNAIARHQRKPDTVEFRFRTPTGSNQILVEKQDDNNQDWFIRLKDNGSADNYGQVSFILSGSDSNGNGLYKEVTSTSLPVYDGDFYSVMVGRLSGSNNTSVSQSYQLNVGKYDSSRSKIHLYSTSTMDVTQAASSSFSNAWTGSGDIYIGGSGSLDGVGVQFSGSIMEYRHWTEVLNTGSFKNHIANPKAYNGNTVSSSYNNLVLRYSFDDNKDLTSDVAGIRDVSANQTTTLSGSHAGFTGNFFRSVVDELKTHIPSIGALRRSTDKIRIEDNTVKAGFNLNSEHRATVSAYDTAPTDSNKVGIWFAPTDVINNDIINSVGNLNFEDFLGDPRDKNKMSYRGLENVADNYWKKYTAPNNFWDYVRMIKYYDQSLYPQLRKLIPARAKPDIGLLIEPNIFERPKVIVGKKPTLENTYYSASIDIATADDGLIIITGSYNGGHAVTNYDAYTGRVDIFSYDSGSSVISASAEVSNFEATGSEIRERYLEISLWQTLNQPGRYSDVTMSFGDTLDGAVGGPQVVVSGSRIYGVNQKTMNFYSSSLSASIGNAHSSSFRSIDTDNFSHLTQGLINSYYTGVKNTKKTTSDGQPPIEIIISAPTKLVTTKDGDSTLKTGDGIISEFKEAISKEEKQALNKSTKKKKKVGGLRKFKTKPQTDQDRKKLIKDDKFKQQSEKGGMKQGKNVPDDVKEDVDEYTSQKSNNTKTNDNTNTNNNNNNK